MVAGGGEERSGGGGRRGEEEDRRVSRCIQIIIKISTTVYKCSTTAATISMPRLVCSIATITGTRSLTYRIIISALPVCGARAPLVALAGNWRATGGRQKIRSLVHQQHHLPLGVGFLARTARV